jgi:hypothetical protein
MTLAEIKARHAAVVESRAAFIAVQLVVRAELDKHGVQRVADLPREWRRIVDERARNLKTPQELSRELTRLDRALEALKSTNELQRLFRMPDLRI